MNYMTSNDVIMHLIDTQHGLDNLAEVYADKGREDDAETVREASNAIADVLSMLERNE